MPTHFIYCPRCQEQKQLQASRDQRRAACPSCRLPLLLQAPPPPMALTTEAQPDEQYDESSYSMPGQESWPLPPPPVPFQSRGTQLNQPQSSWKFVILGGSTAILAVLALALGTMVLVLKKSKDTKKDKPAATAKSNPMEAPVAVLPDPSFGQPQSASLSPVATTNPSVPATVPPFVAEPTSAPPTQNDALPPVPLSPPAPANGTPTPPGIVPNPNSQIPPEPISPPGPAPMENP